jgi:hypothetical protein
MKHLIGSIVISLCIISCKPYKTIVNKKFVLFQTTYEQDTLYLQDFIICSLYYDLKYFKSKKNYELPYLLDDILGLIEKNIINHSPLVFEPKENRFSYFLCNAGSLKWKFEKRVIEELKYLFPQNDDKIRVVPHFIFKKQFSVFKSFSRFGIYGPEEQLTQMVDLNLFFIKNNEIIFMNNILLFSRTYEVESIDDESYPFFDLEKIDELIGEVLKEYFERVNA